MGNGGAVRSAKSRHGQSSAEVKPREDRQAPVSTSVHHKQFSRLPVSTVKSGPGSMRNLLDKV